MSNVTLEPNEHKYTSGKKKYPSVSKIMQHFGLTPDYNRFGNETACNFGSAVHKLCELYDEKDLADYDSNLQTHLDAYVSFLKMYNPEWIIIEVPIASKIWGFAGMPDRVGIIDDKNCIVDIKTGAKQPYHQIQTGFYQVLAEEYLDIKIKKRFTLLLKADKFELIEHTNPADRSIAIGLVQAYKWKTNNNLMEE